MRSVLLATLALAVSTPALAADKPSKTTRQLQSLAERANDPQTQRVLVGGLETMLGALLDMRVDGIAKALEPLNGGKRLKMKGETLRDIAIADDKHFDQKMQRGTRTLVAGLGAMTNVLATMAPELEDALDKVDDAMDDLEDKLPRK